MSESERWVLVPENGAHNDCPMYDAFWRTKAEYEGCVKAEIFPRPTLPAAMWAGLLSARPPIPADVWEAMVERLRTEVYRQGMRDISRPAASAALRAALGISDE